MARLIVAASIAKMMREAFALGVDRERAYHGLLAVSVEQIDRERARLDLYTKNRKIKAPQSLDDFAAQASAKLERLPAVERRRAS